MSQEEFEALVAEALESLPPEISQMLENVAVVVQQWPTRRQLQDHALADRYELLGLYEGTPLTQRDTGYGMVLPDKITIFKAPLEAMCQSKESLVEEIRNTVVHELAHHFGIEDKELQELGY
ncbi:MAG: metallopeptidase family protein [Chloroflexi bacterium]|nr:metallopeptidase family protein [Chloroflexota bacterium]